MASFIGIRTSPVLLSLNLGATIGVIAVLAQLHKAGGLSGNTFPETYTADLCVDSLPALVAIRESVPDARWCSIEQRLTRSRGS